MSLRPEYLSQNLAAPIHTKDGGTLRTIQDACAYMAAISKEREQLPHWQHVRKLILEEPDVTALSWQFRLAILKDAKIDVSKTPAAKPAPHGVFQSPMTPNEFRKNAEDCLKLARETAIQLVSTRSTLRR
jgi:hypothetical protein